MALRLSPLAVSSAEVLRLEGRIDKPKAAHLQVPDFSRRHLAVRSSSTSNSCVDSAENFECSPSPVGRRGLVAAPILVAACAPLLGAIGSAFAAEEGVCEFSEGPGGLLYCDTVVGSGFQATPGALIKAHYTGRLLNDSVFDSSYRRGRPLTFRVGVGEVIRGWDVGILGDEEQGMPAMLAGGKRTLRIPAALAYGARGAGCRGGSCAIPPNSDLIFEVELVGKA